MRDEAAGGSPWPDGLTVADLDRDNGRFWKVDLRAYAERQLRQHGVPSGRLDADDVVQSAWLELHTANTEIRWADRYAYRVARNAIRRAAREGRRTASTALASDDVPVLGEAYPTAYEQEWNSPVEYRVLQQETASEIAAAKERLTPLQRGAVEGTVEHGLPRSDVAAQMRVRVGTVSAHRARGLSKLRAELVGLFLLWLFLLSCAVSFALVHPPGSLASGVGGLLVLLVTGVGKLVHSLRREGGRIMTYGAEWLAAAAALGLTACVVVLIVVSRSADGTPGLDYASGAEPTLNRSGLESCLVSGYPRCPGNQWWWSTSTDEPLRTTFALDGAGTSRALRGRLWLDPCGLDDISVRWSIAAGSRQVASGTMTTHGALESRALTGEVPRQARTLVLTVRRTDSDSDCHGVFTWDKAGVEATRR
ncbi:sigma-70 family RNA polymerase sigma factor [Streptomyces sp. MK37H]|uniref:sigma-70 family RNA polymerase sigma factor n=1 Tax=Streptomyces sp. MK37H TaxID=2699117 RepID=UPI001B3759FA|nr:sigma-70 family RNA polymerase sigma factor [Streptomyces sp. MK37H]MBP8534629.1 sigma-70 family RNA polymerase sigma factor [Streptomyces sp. MK37H]